MKYILYARKSTEDKGRQMLSLESQISTMRKLASDLDLKIIKVFTESKSAKKPDNRPQFTEMLKMIENGEADGILCWKLDRLSRNPIDSGRILWLSQQGTIKEIQTSERKYLPDDNALLFNVESGMANQAIRDLSKGVKRGNKTKLEKGGWPGKAPLGYLNDKINKTVFVDKKRAEHIKRLFSLYSQGNKSFKEISTILYSEGLRSHKDKKVGKSVLHRLISEPFYYGVMLRSGEYYQGKHEPLISKKVFDTAQDVLLGKNDSRKNKHFYPYRSFMTCAECGCVLTGDTKKGRYVYYYCTNGKGKCNQHKKYMAGKKADELMADALAMIQFDPKMIDLVYRASIKKFEENGTDREQLKADIEKRLKSTQEKQSRLVDMYLDNSMLKNDYEAKSKELQLELLDLESQKNNLSKKISNELSTFELTKEMFLTANKAKNELLNAKDEKKVHVIEKLLSNLLVRDQEMASVSFKMPYEIMKKSPKKDDFLVLSGRRDSNPV